MTHARLEKSSSSPSIPVLLPTRRGSQISEIIPKAERLRLTCPQTDHPRLLELDTLGGAIYNRRQFSKTGVKIEKDISTEEKQTPSYLRILEEDEQPGGPEAYQPEKGKGPEAVSLELRMARSFGPDRRICRTRDFREVLAKGKRIEGEYLRFYLHGRDRSGCARLGVSLKRGLGTAVVRNRSKRLVKEAFRLHQDELPAGTELIVAVTRDISGMKLRGVERIFSGMIRKAGLISKPSAGG